MFILEAYPCNFRRQGYVMREFILQYNNIIYLTWIAVLAKKKDSPLPHCGRQV